MLNLNLGPLHEWFMVALKSRVKKLKLNKLYVNVLQNTRSNKSEIKLKYSVFSIWKMPFEQQDRDDSSLAGTVPGVLYATVLLSYEQSSNSSALFTLQFSDKQKTSCSC